MKSNSKYYLKENQVLNQKIKDLGKQKNDLQEKFLELSFKEYTSYGALVATMRVIAVGFIIGLFAQHLMHDQIVEFQGKLNDWVQSQEWLKHGKSEE